MRRVVDLTRTLGPDTQVYPGDPEPVITPVAGIAADGCNLAAVYMGSQSGTHADAPYHFRADGARIDELDPRLFLGHGVVVDAGGLPARTPIPWGHIAAQLGGLAPGTIVLLRTGWARHYGTPAYFDHPYLNGEAATRLLELGVRTLGVDCPNPDETPDDAHPGDGWPVHRAFAAAGGVLIENLCRLEEVDFPKPWISALPIPLAAADGAPVRAVAMDAGPGVT
jgi:kynurenine formamidase